MDDDKDMDAYALADDLGDQQLDGIITFKDLNAKLMAVLYPDLEINQI